MQRDDVSAESATDATAARLPYEPPILVELGTLHDVTRHDDKGHGGSDGFAFQRSHHIVHTSR